MVVILPVHYKFAGEWGIPTNSTEEAFFPYAYRMQQSFYDDLEAFDEKVKVKPDKEYLWMYVAFVYLFSGLAIYLLVRETTKIIRVRQGILGRQSTITDRTIRLSGIPPELRSEEKIKEFIEDLEIGKVDSVMLCRDWGELDGLMAKRMQCLRRLEEAWTVHLGYRRHKNIALPTTEPRDEDDERSHLLGYDDSAHVSSYDKDRPTTKIRFGFLKLQSRSVDAIDYYEEKLRKLDEKIKDARKKEYSPTPLAFVTMDSTAACVSSPVLLISRLIAVANGCSSNPVSNSDATSCKSSTSSSRYCVEEYVSSTNKSNGSSMDDHDPHWTSHHSMDVRSRSTCRFAK